MPGRGLVRQRLFPHEHRYVLSELPPLVPGPGLSLTRARFPSSPTVVRSHIC